MLGTPLRVWLHFIIDPLQNSIEIGAYYNPFVNEEMAASNIK